MDFIQTCLATLASSVILVWLIQQAIIAHSCKNDKTIFENEKSKLNQKILELEKQYFQQQEKISEKIHRQELLSKYKFDNNLGIYFDNSTNDAYCQKCLDKLKETPLKIETFGWTCQVCECRYINPNYKRPSRTLGKVY